MLKTNTDVTENDTSAEQSTNKMELLDMDGDRDMEVPLKHMECWLRYGPRVCVRPSCENATVMTRERGGQYCGNECLVMFAREEFLSWVVDREEEERKRRKRLKEEREKEEEEEEEEKVVVAKKKQRK